MLLSEGSTSTSIDSGEMDARKLANFYRAIFLTPKWQNLIPNSLGFRHKSRRKRVQALGFWVLAFFVPFSEGLLVF